MLSKILLFIVFTGYHSLSAQRVDISDIPLGNWNIQHYTIHDGLKQMQVNDVFVASDGKVWLATRAGVCTFNGESFDRFEDIESRPHHALGIDQYADGTIIIDSGRYLYFYKNGVFEKVKVPDSFRPNYLSRMVIDWNDALWLQWEEEVIIYDKPNFLSPEEYLNDRRFENLTSFSMDHADKEIYACTKNYIVKYKNATFDTVYTYHKKAHELDLPEKKTFVNFRLDINTRHQYDQAPGINCVSQTPDGEHFLYLDYRNEEVTQYGFGESSIDTSLMKELPYSMALAHREELILNHNGSIVKLLSNIGQSYNHFLSITEREGTYYVGTDKGFLVIQESDFTHYPEKQFPYTWSVFEDEKNVLHIGSWGNGVKQLDGSSISFMSKLPPAYLRMTDRTYYHPSRSYNNTKIIPYLGGLMEMRDGQLFHKHPKKREGTHSVLYTEVDTVRDHRIILAVCPGIEILDKDYNLITKIDTGLIEHRCILNIQVDKKGHYWFGSTTGISRYDPETDHIKNYDFTVSEKPQSGATCALIDQKGTLWIGGKNGVSYYDRDMDTFVYVDALRHHNVSSIIQSTADKYFLGTLDGLVMVDLDQLKKNGVHRSKLFGPKEGFRGIQCGQNGFFEDSKGLIWITTTTDLISFNPNDLTYDMTIPKVSITKINGNRIDSTQTTKTSKNAEEIIIEFEPISTTSSSPLVYSYNINDGPWSTWNKSTQARLPELASGKYVINVKAKPHNTDIESKISSATFSVSNSLTNEPYFNKVLLGATLLALMSAFLFYKNQRLQRQLNRVLENKNIKLKSEKEELNAKKNELQTEKTELIFEKSELVALNKSLQQKLARTPNPQKKEMSITSMNKHYVLDYSDVFYIKAEDPGIRIFATHSSLWSEQKLKHIKQQLGYPFVQIFRSTLVNINKIDWVNSDKVRLHNGTELKMSRTYKKEIQDIVKQV